MKKKIIIGAVLAVLLLSVIAVIILLPKVKAYIPYYKDKNGIDQEDLPYTLTIEKTDFENEVASRLAENGVIISSVRFLNFIKEKHPDFVWYNGIYHLNANMSYEEICNALKTPDEAINYVKFVVPEGKNVASIAKIVAESGLCSEEEFLSAADSYEYDYTFLSELKERNQGVIGYKLEGYLFPATYEFRADTVTAREIVDKMLKTFEEYIGEDLILQAKNKGLSLNEFVTLASVVQAEAFSTESMSGVSGVFWNRLNSKSMRLLQSDPTTNYAKSLKNLPTYSEDMRAAYDTYKCVGLPVGPTNCPGIDALKAVLAPEESEYYYFVTDKNGAFYFNKTLEDHNKTIRDLKNKGMWA